MSGRGRPRVNDPKVPLQVRLSYAERSVLERAATKAFMKLSTWIRKVCLDTAKKEIQ